MQLFTLPVELRRINIIPLRVLPPSLQPLIFGSQRNSVSLFLDERASRHIFRAAGSPVQFWLALQVFEDQSTGHRAAGTFVFLLLET